MLLLSHWSLKLSIFSSFPTYWWKKTQAERFINSQWDTRAMTKGIWINLAFKTSHSAKFKRQTMKSNLNHNWSTADSGATYKFASIPFQHCLRSLTKINGKRDWTGSRNPNNENNEACGERVTKPVLHRVSRSEKKKGVKRDERRGVFSNVTQPVMWHVRQSQTVTQWGPGADSTVCRTPCFYHQCYLLTPDLLLTINTNLP